MLANYLHKFANLNTDKSNSRWGIDTCYRAPHKSLLLLAVMDLLAEGVIRQNLIELTEEICEVFSGYWAKVMPLGRKRGNIAMPFFHLQSEGFWHLIARPGKESFLHAVPKIHSVIVLNETVFGAKLNEDLFELMQYADNRDALRRILIETYFAQELQEKLLLQAIVNMRSYEYSEYLLSRAKEHLLMEDPEKFEFTSNQEVRDQGFRRAIVKAYEHRCALCGIRILTADGHTAIAAAHIIPWSVSHNDDPRNGLALCSLCHWIFDEGLTGLTDNYLVLLSPQLSADRNIPGHLMTIEGRRLIGPQDTNLWPHLDSLRWHRKEIFRDR